MARRKNKKEDAVIVDLSERKKIQIIQSSPTCVTDEDMEEFENKLIDRYNDMKEFSEHCIQNRAYLANEPISDAAFEKTMKEMLKQHKLLRSMINGREN